MKYKRLDLAEAACKRMGRKLIVANEVSDEELRALYAGAKALLFPGIEDFGIVPVEAQAAGTPVITYGHGGAIETVMDGETGLFFHEQTVESLCAAIEEFESRAWDSGVCTENRIVGDGDTLFFAERTRMRHECDNLRQNGARDVGRICTPLAKDSHWHGFCYS